MRKYLGLLFDADNTLLDFNAAQKQALTKLFAEKSLTITPEMEKYFDEENKKMWLRHENGELSREELLNSRFQVIFKHFGLDVDGPAMEASYRNYLNEAHQLMDGAKDLLEKLHSRFNLYLVTNGSAKTQYRRLNDAGIIPYFKELFISEEIGAQKPQKEFFNYVLRQIPHLSKDKLLIIGDSLSADIQGGQMADIDTCWFNPAQRKNQTEIKPTYEIHSLWELENILWQAGYDPN